MKDKKLIQISAFMVFIIYALQAYALPPTKEIFTAIQKLREAKSKMTYGYSAKDMERCLTPYIATIAENWDSLPTMYKNEFEGISLRPVESGSIFGTSSSLPLKFETAHFKFHYTKKGPDAVYLEDLDANRIPDYVEICAKAYERAFHLEVEVMGFQRPLSDLWVENNGGNDKYDVYIYNFPAFGYTSMDWFGRVIATSETYVPYLAMNSKIYDYVGKSEGKHYLQTTSPHELLHAIQFGYNGAMPRWFMEATATWIESVAYDGGVVDDGDDIDDSDYIEEVDGFDYYASQLRYWFLHPDYSLDLFDGWHEYGDVIWAIYLTERFGTDIIRQVYTNTTQGSYRGMGNFWDPLNNHGTNLAETFKTFTVWNYFTRERDDGKHYSRGASIPPVAIHPNDIHQDYPVKKFFDSETMPPHFSSRYIVFEPPPGENMNIGIRVNGGDLTDDEDDLEQLKYSGLRGWGTKLIVEMNEGPNVVDEIFTYHRSQEGQRNFENFGGKIKRIVLILINMHPDIEPKDNSISYVAGTIPEGELEPPILSNEAENAVRLSWDVVDLTDIKEVAIVRKRYDPGVNRDLDDSNLTTGQALHATDLYNVNTGQPRPDNIPEDNIDIIARVNATDTTFVDPTVFNDIDVTSNYFDPSAVKYFYGVVPVNEDGLFGKPSIAEKGITPMFNGESMSLGAPRRCDLLQNYPNPFNPETWIPYKLAHEENVFIRISNIQGKLVRLIDLGRRPAGEYLSKDRAAFWDGRNSYGEKVASGIYFYQMQAGDYTATRKMLILK